MRAFLAAALAVFLGGAAVFAGVGAVPAAAVNAPLGPVVTVGSGAPFEPSANKPRRYIINVLSSVLKGATPSAWKRERIANASQYNFGWESLAVELGSAGPLNGNYRKNPSSYDDYVLKGIEKKSTTLGTRAKKMFAVPATPLGKVAKVAGGVGAVMVGWDVGSAAGRGISGLMGLDPASMTCDADTFLGINWEATLVGADCDSYFRALAEEYERNEDAVAGIYFPDMCIDDLGCLTVRGVNTVSTPVVCFHRTGSGWGNTIGVTRPTVEFQYPNGEWSTEQGFRGSPFSSSFGSCAGVFGLTAADHNTVPLSAGNAIWQHFDWNNPESVALAPTRLKLGTVRFDPVTPTVTDGDPTRQMVCEITGTDSNTYTAHSEEYQESAGYLPQVICPDLPDGVYPAHTTIWDTHAGRAAPMYDEAATPEFLNWATDFGHCDEGACPLVLYMVDGDKLVACHDLDFVCDGWFEDPQRDSTYQCHYAGEHVDISECFIYSGMFNEQRLAIGAPYSDPETGIWSGGQNSPTPGEQLMSGPVRDPGSSRDCWENGWREFNPFEWVATPVRCVFEWAFVPRSGIVALEAQKMGDALNNRAPGQLVSMVSNWNIDPSPMTGCSRSVNWSPDNHLSGSTGTTVLWDVCPGSPYEALGEISRAVVGVGFTVMVFLAIKRFTARTVDYT